MECLDSFPKSKELVLRKNVVITGVYLLSIFMGFFLIGGLAGILMPAIPILIAYCIALFAQNEYQSIDCFTKIMGIAAIINIAAITLASTSIQLFGFSLFGSLIVFVSIWVGMLVLPILLFRR
ncbi:MAG: hypothetical protein PHZ25_04005 [Candidatus Pacebacteria bacterium]|nr:hypothetical protein [Candidatus Paceibacterota bacterium]